MPMRQASGTLIAGTYEATVIIPGDSGILKAACLSQASGQLAAFYRRPAQYYAAIFISLADSSTPFPYIMLAEGRIGSYTAVSWTGSLRRETGQLLYGLISGYDACTFILRSFTEI